jgi:hypothetical protein
MNYLIKLATNQVKQNTKTLWEKDGESLLIWLDQNIIPYQIELLIVTPFIKMTIRKRIWIKLLDQDIKEIKMIPETLFLKIVVDQIKQPIKKIMFLIPLEISKDIKEKTILTNQIDIIMKEIYMIEILLITRNILGNKQKPAKYINYQIILLKLNQEFLI